jgi:hypothetical protein
MLRILLPFLVVLATACLYPLSQCHASKVKVWHHHAAAHYDKAQFKQAVVTSEGGLQLSRQLEPLAGLDATHVWDLVEDKQGNLFVATGDEGKLYRVDTERKASLVYTSTDSQILSLALAGDGTLYAGTGPSGLIICVPPKGKPRVLTEHLGEYVWSLVYDEDAKTLYAGTGPSGRIYQVDRDGSAKVFYSTRQEHILSLARGPNQTLYAGTSRSGLVYRIDREGKGFVMYSAPQGEVRSLLMTAEGVYAGTSAPTRRSISGIGASGTAGSFSPINSGKSNTPTGKPDDGSKLGIIPAAVQGSASDKPTGSEESKHRSASAPSAPGSGENSLYRIAADGTVRELFREKAMVLCLMRQGPGTFLAGTGMNGQLFEINEKTREKSEIARLDHGQIQCLCQRRDGSIVIGAGDPGKLYVLQQRFANKGTVLSPVLDAKMVSKWGALNWKADTPKGTRVTVAVRSGNLAEPDETWSDWSAEQTDEQKAIAQVPAARFLQYRVTLSTMNADITPTLHSMTVRYATTNHAPEITSLELPDLDATNLENPKKIKLRWSAVDPNEDELTYDLYVRKEGWKSWVQIAEVLTKRDYEWDTSGMASGMYQVKVVASDRRDNSEENALMAERISAAFPICHTPPKITLRHRAHFPAGGDVNRPTVCIEATATSPLVRLTEASISLNGKRWKNIAPQDGLFDSRSEEFQFICTEDLVPGPYVLLIRVTDAAGNMATADYEFIVQKKQ